MPPQGRGSCSRAELNVSRIAARQFGYLAVFLGTFLEARRFSSPRGSLPRVDISMSTGSRRSRSPERSSACVLVLARRAHGVKLLDRFQSMKRPRRRACGLRALRSRAIVITQWIYGLASPAR